MGDKGQRDKGKREAQKEAKLSLKDKRKQKKGKKTPESEGFLTSLTRKAP